MKYLLALGLLGMADAFLTTCSQIHLNAPDGYCSKSLGILPTSVGNFYICRDSHLFEWGGTIDDCPTGWALTTSGGTLSSNIGTGHCYLKAAQFDHALLDTICANADGDYCPVDQSPADGVCVADSGTTATTTTTTTAAPVGCLSGYGGSPCVACDAGKYSSGAGCTDCDAGEYQDQAGQASCEVCDKVVTADKQGCIGITKDWLLAEYKKIVQC